MGIPNKTMEDMVRLIEQSFEQHLKVFGTTLTKKEIRAAAESALAKKRDEWIKARLADRSVPDLHILLEALGEAEQPKKSLLEKLRGS